MEFRRYGEKEAKDHGPKYEGDQYRALVEEEEGSRRERKQMRDYQKAKKEFESSISASVPFLFEFLQNGLKADPRHANFTRLRLLVFCYGPPLDLIPSFKIQSPEQWWIAESFGKEEIEDWLQAILPESTIKKLRVDLKSLINWIFPSIEKIKEEKAHYGRRVPGFGWPVSRLFPELVLWVDKRKKGSWRIYSKMPFLDVIFRKVMGLLIEEADRIGRCPECDSLFYKVRRQKFCSRRCTVRENVRRSRAEKGGVKNVNKN